MPTGNGTSGGGRLIAAARQLAAECDGLRFGAPVAHVYNPLQYARGAHEAYLRKFGGGQKRAVFVGMNPGPWGMAQTGVPFGEVAAVKNYLGIAAGVAPPTNAHRKRPILGFACNRSEVSGARLWALFARRYGAASAFFGGHFVINYCPLMFLRQSASGGAANLTPDKLAAAEREPLFAACDKHLLAAARALRPQVWVGVGGFAAARLQGLFGDEAKVGKILHPSPANPQANKNFAAAAARQLRALGL